MNRNSKQTLVLTIALAAGFALVFALSNYVENTRPPVAENYEDEDLSLRAARLKGFALGFEGLLADWYWMQSLQYIGGKIEKSRQTHINLDDLRSLDPRLLHPLLDTATTLDPHFLAAYSYGAVVLPAVDPAQAIEFTEKGISDNPSVWRLYHHLGYIHWRLGDYEKAAGVYSRGAAINGAPPFMRLMAAQMKTEGGSRATARAMYEQIFNEAEDEMIKENAALRLVELDSLDERDAISRALAAFQERNGRCPADWREALSALRNQKTADGRPLRFDASTGAPIDPSGAAYLLTNGCDVALDPAKSKIPPR